MYEALDRCEEILGKHRYICGNTLTETDIRLFVTLIRFDEVSENRQELKKNTIKGTSM